MQQSDRVLLTAMALYDWYEAREVSRHLLVAYSVLLNVFRIRFLTSLLRSVISSGVFIQLEFFLF